MSGGLTLIVNRKGCKIDSTSKTSQKEMSARERWIVKESRQKEKERRGKVAHHSSWKREDEPKKPKVLELSPQTTQHPTNTKKANKHQTINTPRNKH